MRDYEKQAADLRLCAESDDPVDECCWEECTAHQGDRSPMCRQKTMLDAADAIEELVAAVPPLLWTDEQIKGSEFMTHVQGGRGFEIHFRTDNAEKYKAVQEECRRQIDHAKPEPPKKEA